MTWLNRGQEAFMESMRKYASTTTTDGTRRSVIADQLSKIGHVKETGIGEDERGRLTTVWKLTQSGIAHLNRRRP